MTGILAQTIAITSFGNEYLKSGNLTNFFTQNSTFQHCDFVDFREMKKGTNPMTLPATMKLPKYKDWAMYEEWLPMNIWRILLDEFMGPFPWRPNHEYQKE